MRPSLAIVALAAGALAVPFNNNNNNNKERDVVTEWEYFTAYNVVTVTADQLPPQEKPTPKHHHVHHHHHNAGYTTTYTTSLPAYTPPAQSHHKSSKTHEKAPAYSAPSGNGYKGKVIHHHNIHRANHSCEALEWDEGLAASAQTIAESCVYAHNTDVDGGGYGQNIAAGVAAENISAIITDLFYNGEAPYFQGLYGQSDPDMTNFENWGHFSQMVWKKTTKVGCATVSCPGGLANTGDGVEPVFTVCNYGPPGNYAGEYGDNVLKPLGHPSANWNTGTN